MLTLLGGCVSGRTPANTTRASEPSIQSLCQDIRGLSPSVDPHEARALADVALNRALDLADQYRVVKPASLHNVFVNLGLKERGLCYHFADDLLERLRQVALSTLEVHRVVSKPNARHEHNALVVSAKNRPLQEGILLDAWRHGGRLFWIRVPADKPYKWEPRTDLPPPGQAPPLP